MKDFRFNVTVCVKLRETINLKKFDYSPYVIHLVSVYKIFKYVNILQMLGNIVKCSNVR